MPSDLLIPIVVVAGSLVAAAIDLRTRRVPNVLTGAMALAGLTLAAAGSGRFDLATALVGGVVGLALMLPGHVFGATGAGDVKLLAAAGTLLGPGDTLVAFVATAIAGGVLAVVVAVIRGRVGVTARAVARLVATGGANTAEIESTQSNNRFAYAPAIAIGVAVAALTF
jgi:prepilin peptidase CpaA